MPRQEVSLRSTITILAAALLFAATTAAAQVETALHNFGNTTRDGSYPLSNLIFDSAGNLYGTTGEGGAYGYGTVFELSPQSGGGWTEKDLHSFNFNGIDGFNPYAGLIFDASGNLYGTTSDGGSGGNCGIDGCGTVFELTQVGGVWRERILYSFKDNGVDGFGPLGGVIFGSSGRLYGVTAFGGAYGQGIVFELAYKSGAGWSEHILHTFHHDGTTNFDGANPLEALISDSSGNLYGTANGGGTHGWGTVFEMSPATGGAWTEKTVYNFNNNGSDGNTPVAGVIFDASGNLYGTTVNGGTAGLGTVFELVNQGGGNWSEAILHSFSQNGTDGFHPEGGVIFDGSGNLFGTTADGGNASSPNGIVYELTPSGGAWTETILFNFSRSGASPQASLVFGASGNLYGTTSSGGAFNLGTVFELTP
jgi:uncharacterized repeat protein (TIGR03803 family)